MVQPLTDLSIAWCNMKDLIKSLDSENISTQRQAGDKLAAAGVAAIPAMLDALLSGTPNARKSVAFLLGNHRKSLEVVEALSHAILNDPEPKVRKNAAISLGKIGNSQVIDVLKTALQQEEITWVRRSIILALGAIGGKAAYDVLTDVSAIKEGDKEALRKALDRAIPRQINIDWNRQVDWNYELLVEVPLGLEFVAVGEAIDNGLYAIKYSPGLLQLAKNTPPWDLFSKMRCIYGIRIVAGKDVPINLNDRQQCVNVIRNLISKSQQLAKIREWILTDEEEIKYRFSFKKSTNKEILLLMLETARKETKGFGLIDSPSNYDLELIFDTDSDSSSLFIKPSFYKDTRFVYRKKDVPASINPVVASCLVRLVHSKAEGVTFDPTCGSGTLLIERALLDGRIRLIGLDINKEAVIAAKANIKAAMLTDRIQVSRGDASDLEKWPQCDEVIANLPFGIRTRREETDLERLYHDIISNIAVRLRPSGKALLYSSNKKAFERGLYLHKRMLKTENSFKVFSGGLWINVLILTRRI
mgnify:CR=1 FL=1